MHVVCDKIAQAREYYPHTRSTIDCMSETTISEENAPNCAVCNESIVDLPSYRVIATADDGDVEYKHFCDASCESSYHT